MTIHDCMRTRSQALIRQVTIQQVLIPFTDIRGLNSCSYFDRNLKLPFTRCQTFNHPIAPLTLPKQVPVLLFIIQLLRISTRAAETPMPFFRS